MIPLSSRDSRPVWEQVADGLRRLLSGGAYLPGESLPPPETLAGQLALNPQAVRTAYQALIRQGLLEWRESGAPVVAAAAAEEGRRTLLNTWDEATVALLTGGYPRRELEKRLKEARA